MKEVQQTVLIHGRPVRYRVRRSARARRLSLRVAADIGLEVVLPRRWALRDVDQALREHADWIEEQVEKYGVRLGPRIRELVAGDTVLVMGEPRTLRVEGLPAGRSRSRVRLEEETLVVGLGPDDELDPRRPLEAWLRRLAGSHLRERVAELAAEHGLRPRRVMVGERTSRWGSCSARGTLSFCYRLVMAPPAVIDAVVCHELCHLRHLHHGPRFYELLDEVWPRHREARAWLNEHHEKLKF